MHLFRGIIQSQDQLRGVINGDGSVRSGFRETFEFDRRFEYSALTSPNLPTTRSFSVQSLVPVGLSFREY